MLAWPGDRDKGADSKYTLKIKVAGLADGLWIEQKGKGGVRMASGFRAWAVREVRGHCRWGMDGGGVGVGRLLSVVSPEETMG